MKKTLSICAALASAFLPTFGHAAAPSAEPAPEAALHGDVHCCGDDHFTTPIGIMFDHTHSAGGWMVGYRYSYSDYSGLQQNGNSISNQDVYDAGYGMAPVSMDMHMHMLEVMYSPTDWLTLMVMPMYMEMNMTMRGGMAPGAMSGAHGGHSMMGEHSHGTSGWGDTNASAIIRLWNGEHQQLLAALGLSIPTGSVDEKVNGKYTHYMMQLGSGTWDLTPSVTYKGHAGRVFWGAQYLSALRLQDANDSGYRIGNVHQASAWTGVELADWVNVSGRINYRHEGQLRGHYDGPHSHSSPPDRQVNYGGDTLDLGVGLNLVVPRGALKGNRFGIEALWPVNQDLNGIQLERDFTLVVGWQWSF